MSCSVSTLKAVITSERPAMTTLASIVAIRRCMMVTENRSICMVVQSLRHFGCLFTYVLRLNLTLQQVRYERT